MNSRTTPSAPQDPNKATAEDDLCAGKAGFAALLDAIPLAVCILGPGGRFIDLNEGACSMFGYAREHLLGRTLEFLGEPGRNEMDTVSAVIERASHGKPQEFEFSVRKKNGEIIVCRIQVRKGTYAGGDVLVLTGSDITEQKRSETALRQSEERFRHLLDAVTDYLFSVRVENKKAVQTRHGPGCLAVTGYTAEEMDADPDLWIRMVVPEDRPRVIRQSEQILSGEEARAIEHRIIRRDGDMRWVRNTSVPTVDPDGRLTGYDGLIEDITNRVIAEEALRKSDAQLHAIVIASPIPKFVIDKDHRVISWNRAMEAITTIPARKILGTKEHWRAFFSAERACLADVLVDGNIKDLPALYGDKIKKMELVDGSFETTGFYPNLGRNGMWLHLIAAPIVDDQGKVIGAVETIEDISDLIRVQHELLESEERYSSLFSNSYSVSLIIDPDTGRIVDANDAALRYYGYSHGEMTAKGIHELNHQPRDIVVRNLKRAKSGKEKHFFSTHYLADGSKRYVEIYSGPIRVQGKPLFYSIIHDITDRRVAEKALEESEERYSSLFTNNSSVSLLIDPDTGRIIDANAAALRYYGYSHQQMTSMGIYDINRKNREDVVRNLKWAKVRKGRHFFATHYLHDGTKRYVEIYSGPISVRGKPLFYSIIHDITDRRIAEKALHESEERYRTLIDQLPDYVIVHREGVLLYVNPAAAAQLGYRSDDLIGRPFFTMIDPASLDVVRHAMELRMKGEPVPPYEICIVSRDREKRTVLVHGSRIQFDGAAASLNVLSDITPMKEAEETIRKANEVLEKRVKERTEELSRSNELLVSEIAARQNAEKEITRSLEEKVLLLREIHHRVKNNLQIIASLLKLQSRYIKDRNVLESLEDSQSRVRAMALVHERIYRSHNIADINVKEYLNYLVRQVSQFYHTTQHPVSITVTMDEIVADIDTVVPVGLIMNELLSNSLKHAFADGRYGSISIECTLVLPDILHFVYHDNGTGLPAGFNWKEAESLGLRLINNLVDQLNGTIVQGEGPGATFVIDVHRKMKEES